MSMVKTGMLYMMINVTLFIGKIMLVNDLQRQDMSALFPKNFSSKFSYENVKFFIEKSVIFCIDDYLLKINSKCCLKFKRVS